MDKIGEICRKRKQAHQKLLSMDSKVYRAFLDMETAAYADDALAKKHKELIAVGIFAAPIIHRFLHSLHIETEKNKNQ